LFRIKTNQLQPNYYYNPSQTVLLSQTIYRFISPTDIDIYTLKGDYEQNFKKGRLGIGLKYPASGRKIILEDTMFSK
jgi:hypothetical protein